MASAVYPLWIQAMWQGDVAGGLDAVNVKAAAVAVGYTYSASDQFLSDIDGGDIVATSGNLTGKTFNTSGDFDADDAPVAAVTGDEIVALVVYHDSGAAATSRLICYLELGSTYTPTGADVVFVFHADGLVEAA